LSRPAGRSKRVFTGKAEAENCILYCLQQLSFVKKSKSEKSADFSDLQRKN